MPKQIELHMNNEEAESQSIVDSEKKPGFQLPDSIVDFVQSVAVALVICIIMYLLIAMPNQVQGNSMEPTFHQGEIILTNKVSTWLGGTGVGKSIGLNYTRGDIIVFKKPGNSDFIKRIIGEPGDTIELIEGNVYINNVKLDESSYLQDRIYTQGGTFLREDQPIVVPEGSFFVMGDNRENSQDSRFYEVGFVQEEWIKGEVMLRYWPPITIFDHPEYNI